MSPTILSAAASAHGVTRRERLALASRTRREPSDSWSVISFGVLGIGIALLAIAAVSALIG